MISFKAFIEGINSAIVSANEYLMDKHEGLLDTYFDTTETVKTGSRPASSSLTPKSVKLQYPKPSATGEISMVDVDVPLITLVPLEFSKIDKVKITAQFDLLVINNELQIIFSSEEQKRKFSLFGKATTQTKSGSPGQIEITIRPTDTPEGLKKIIEGYDKVLRAQIPH
jgi:hypothetical protein